MVDKSEVNTHSISALLLSTMVWTGEGLMLLHPAMVYHCTQEIFCRGKFWQTTQVKAIGKEKFGEYATLSA